MFKLNLKLKLRPNFGSKPKLYSRTKPLGDQWYRFSWAGCSSHHPTNGVKALKETKALTLTSGLASTLPHLLSDAQRTGSCSLYASYPMPVSIVLTRAQQLLRWATVWPQQTCAEIDMGWKVEGCCAIFPWGELGPHLTQCRLAEDYLCTKWRSEVSSV